MLVCWRCGASLGDMPLPLSRFAECKSCHASLHVCRQCEFYDTAYAKHCREPIAEEVKDKTRANFCDYFRAKAGAWQAPDTAAAGKAQADLEALFGLESGSAAGSPATADAARSELDRLFGLNKK
jgi:ribosomal protein L40E